ncbi:hypothetical protein TSAR_009097 [Trichomalopsis sarcophagae]|uniref:C2H2-type domain-containing protein n=1 Tax=Trichomalopsis sarcophagae TaxID=543379 RepID=A0A232FFT6_9HYME|nr:hypothetical protein TSAR_009097 [Trichomalopsis sarcophagae]
MFCLDVTRGYVKRQRSKSDVGPYLRIGRITSVKDEGIKKIYNRSSEGSRERPYATVKFFCENCDQELNIRETAYFNNRPHMCKKCLSPLLFICKKCGRNFKTANGAYIHGNIRCNVRNFMDCELCSYKTTIKNDLKKHMKNVHAQQ